jgi:membrane protein required for colicin V production
MLKQLISLVGIIVGLVLAKMFYMVLGEALSPHLNDNVSLANGIAFIAIWVLVPAALGLVAELITTVLDHIAIVGTMNKLMGAVFGLFKYCFLIGAVMWALVACKLLSEETLGQTVIGTTLKAFSESFYTALINA